MTTISYGVGDTIQFLYSSKNHPTTIRTVTIEKMTPEYIEGHDDYVDDFRRFKKSGMTQVQHAKKQKEIYLVATCSGKIITIVNPLDKKISFWVGSDGYLHNLDGRLTAAEFKDYVGELVD